MSDLISRQAAIDEVVAWMKDRLNNKKNWKPLTEILRDLPSAQSEIIRCKDCYHNHNCDIQYRAQAGDMFFCAGAERRTDE